MCVFCCETIALPESHTCFEDLRHVGVPSSSARVRAHERRDSGPSCLYRRCAFLENNSFVLKFSLLVVLLAFHERSFFLLFFDKFSNAIFNVCGPILSANGNTSTCNSMLSNFFCVAVHLKGADYCRVSA